MVICTTLDSHFSMHSNIIFVIHGDPQGKAAYQQCNTNCSYTNLFCRPPSINSNYINTLVFKFILVIY